MPGDNSAQIERTLLEVADIAPRFTPGLLETYLGELFSWNPQLGLISKKDSPAVAARLIRQSVVLWEFVTGEAIFTRAKMPWQIADIGTGGGFPGLIWKMVEPRIHLDLIERKERKAHFLDKVVHRLALKGTHVLPSDVRELAIDEGFQGRYDLAVMMAVATPGALGPDIEPIVRDGGFLASIRPASQQLVEQRVGESFTLIARDNTDTGCLVLYQKTP